MAVTPPLLTCSAQWQYWRSRLLKSNQPTKNAVKMCCQVCVKWNWPAFQVCSFEMPSSWAPSPEPAAFGTCRLSVHWTWPAGESHSLFCQIHIKQNCSGIMQLRDSTAHQRDHSLSGICQCHLWISEELWMTSRRAHRRQSLFVTDLPLHCRPLLPNYRPLWDVE